MRQKAEAFCRRRNLLPQGGRVLCAVSGGIDSMALLHLLWTWSREGRFALCAATFDHRLRDSSGEDAAFVTAWCRGHEIPCISGHGDVAGYAKACGENLEQAARTLRYGFLKKTAADMGADVIATAHNADDQAETLLLHLLRGSGLKGLGGIPPKRGRIVRPLLEVSREEIQAYVRQHDIPFREDESNADTAYTRNYLRHRVLPLLKEKNPNLLQTLGRTAESLGQDQDYLSQQTQIQADRLVYEGAISVKELLNLHPAIALRLIQTLAEQAKAGTVLPWQQRAAVLELAKGEHPSGSLSLTGGLQARLEYDVLQITERQETVPGFASFTLQPGQEYFAPELRLVFFCRQAVFQEKRQNRLYLKPGSGEVTLRPRTTGDRIKLPGRGTKTLKKWMIEEKVPKDQRSLLPVLEIEGQVAAVWNMGQDERWIPETGEPALEIWAEERKREEQSL